jgi:hypothetical protein
MIRSACLDQLVTAIGAVRGTSTGDVEKVQPYGRGWLFIEKYTLAPPSRGTRAAFETMTFSACLTWPADAPVDCAR